jgi:2-C-methyl-D-erythritol 4-phosphate cytidylyltransferase
MKNKTTLIIPAAGKSSRFPGLKPKWMLTHPTGKMMINAAISSFNLKNVKQVVVGVLDEHLKKYKIKLGLEKSFKDLGVPVKLAILKNETLSQPETVCNIIELLNLTGPIFVKDADNQFSHTPGLGNYVTVADINKINVISKPASKSYVSYDENGILNNIVEKKIISEYYCTGGYSFSSANSFINTFKKIENENLYVSHVIFEQMLNEDMNFTMSEVENVKDWGTINDWNKYKKKYSTLFLDIDGIIFENTGEFSEKSWGEMPPIDKNIEYLKKIKSEGYCTIILTTARPEKYRSLTINSLKASSIPYDKIIFGLPHAQRIVVNDYANTNPYPSCSSINVKRNSFELESMLNNFLGR